MDLSNNSKNSSTNQPDPGHGLSPSQQSGTGGSLKQKTTPDPQPGGTSSSDDQSFTEVSLPAEAEDNDLIEKEWVERAKQIVEHTRQDPYEQQRALSQMKADYLKKRYNKDIKVTED